MKSTAQDTAHRILGARFDDLTEVEKRVIRRIAERQRISRNVAAEFTEQLSIGERLADRVAYVGGSWAFVVAFSVLIAVWVVANTAVLSKRGLAWDPYPYILLNLLLSTLAALQAPIILMSQNRQAARDRMEAAHDYEVNLKAELEILDLHHKLDGLVESQWSDLIALQQQQLQLLEELLNAKIEPRDQD
ncbi:MAG: DUF1003 domain-containing protein [Anaerolineae bacterium]|jgi:uncharacterized membrane protein